MEPAKILVVEDENIVARDIATSLKRLGYAVPAVASSGEEAVERTVDTHPDLVLMDIVLRGKMDGVQTAQHIHDHFNIPVVYLTAYADEKTLERAKMTEPFGYILKPFEERELRSTIEIALCKSKTESKLRKSEESLATTLKSIRDAVITTDMKGLVTFMNPVAQALTGWKQEDALGKDVTEVFNIINEKTRTPTEKPAVKALQESVVVDLKNHTLLIAKGETETPILLDGAAPIKDEKGNVTGSVLVFRDMTQLKEAEENLLQSEKLRALGEMVAEVGHHFNNFLAIILLNAELLEKKLKRYRAEGIKERLRIIVWTAYEGAEIIRRLQHFTQRQVSIQDFTRIDLNEIVRSAMASTSPHWKDEAEARGTTIKIKEKLGKLPLLLGSRSELMEVLTNLTFNALDAMGEGGEITIRTEAKGNEVLLYFTDTGKGIPKKIKDRIFDPFFTTKDPKASGLGLSVCYGIIKRHKGKIKVDSIKGKGTTFTISIPIPLEVSLEERK
jgi:PAS domain S-box-containing protein